MTFKLNSNSKIISADGTVRPLNSLTDEEYAAFLESVSERMARAFQDYLRQHPEEFEPFLNAVEAVGGTVTRYWQIDDDKSKHRAG